MDAKAENCVFPSSRTMVAAAAAAVVDGVVVLVLLDGWMCCVDVS